MENKQICSLESREQLGKGHIVYRLGKTIISGQNNCVTFGEGKASNKVYNDVGPWEAQDG